ncbi:hypothetical protein [Mycolicibacterium peregrinum]|uniref:hypothetical protein n=1 Tax=Mycolicibacterium peregrinum TaxID=43304 RepID=UPI003AAFFA39
MSNTTMRVRRARKARRGCCGPIQPGEFYIEHTEFPGGESGYANAAGHPVRLAENRACAERYGRGPLIAAAEASR